MILSIHLVQSVTSDLSSSAEEKFLHTTGLWTQGRLEKLCETQEDPITHTTTPPPPPNAQLTIRIS